jgi:hypothetical protein
VRSVRNSGFAATASLRRPSTLRRSGVSATRARPSMGAGSTAAVDRSPMGTSFMWQIGHSPGLSDT